MSSEGVVERGAFRARLHHYASSNRIVGVDVARGLAVLGMFAAHLGVSDEFVFGEPDTWLDLANGRSSILFAVLAGFSIALISGRIVPVSGVPLVQARIRIFARAAMIFALGGLLEFLGTQVAVILPAYAVLFVLALPFLTWIPRRLLTLAAILAVVMPIVLATIRPFFELGAPSAIVDLMITGHYPAMIWIVFVLVGLALGRADVSKPATAAKIALTGVALTVVGYGIGLAVAEPVSATATAPLAGTTMQLGNVAELLTIEPHSGSPFEVIGSTGFVLGVLGVCLLATPYARWVLFPLASVGAMALTAYSVHIVGIAVHGDIVGTLDDNSLLLVFVLSALIGCSLWTLLIGRGPLEQLLTRVSHLAARITTVGAGRLDADPTSKEYTQK
ncbi:MAG TPA: heparan-alpha-glucosaminide N-acetyltransferase domain-containing protein [Glaciihabitans sp.]|nr:heparan-alpha-glucosaminide N-acetyltransferase domain-containing protein [Glaciihabitans sp.]